MVGFLRNPDHPPMTAAEAPARKRDLEAFFKLKTGQQ
jgi:hypothetical protein